MSSRVIWRDVEVRLQLRNASEAMMRTAAALIEQQTKLNITANGQVDTGFMRNSVYFATNDDGSYDAAATAARGARHDAGIAPKADAPAGGAVVGVAAEYAIYQEEAQPFLYPAVETVAQRMDGEIVSAGREVIDG